MNARSFIFILLCFARHLRYGLSSNTEERIINGIGTSISSTPYIVSLKINGKHMCSACIINRYWIATAAHCLKATENPLKDITLCSGSAILYKNCTLHKVVDYFVHENYDSVINDYDIAVIKVTPSFTYSNHTKPVDLAPNRFRTNSVRRKWGIVCGWGYYLKFGGIVEPILSDYLQCAVVPHISRRACQEDYKGRYKVTPRMTCYGYQEGGIDACQGDSGGPLVNADNILLGITSWGDGCAQKNSPGVYTDAIPLEDWIKNKTGMGA